jgi:hypothetical protein
MSKSTKTLFQGEALSFDDERTLSVTGFNHVVNQTNADISFFKHGAGGKSWRTGAPRLQFRLTFIVEEGSGQVALVMGPAPSEFGTLAVGDLTVLTEIIKKRRGGSPKRRSRFRTVISTPVPNPACGHKGNGELRRFFKILLTGTPVITVSCLSVHLRGVE